jgi:hypothetical protein
MRVANLDTEVGADFVAIVDPAVSNEQVAPEGTYQWLPVEIVFGNNGVKCSAKFGAAQLTTILMVGTEWTELAKHRFAGICKRTICK